MPETPPRRAARCASSTRSATTGCCSSPSDRISTFDVVLPTPIPDKGRVLTGLSAFWFARTRHIVPNHLLALRDDGRSLECRRLEMLPVEIVVRGYLSGSGWVDYREQARSAATGCPPACASPSGCRSRS